MRSVARTQEVAIRIALGSPRYRIVRIFFLESVLLAVLGGLLGIILAKESLRFAAYFVPLALQTGAPIRIDLKVLVFTALVSTATALVFGLGPALKMSRSDTNELLKTASRGITASPGRAGTGRLLIAGQAALTIVLLTGSFLLLQSFLRLQAVPPGFDPNRVWIGQILLGAGNSRNEASNPARLERILALIGKVPSVEAVSSTTSLPLEKGLNLPIYPADAPEKVEHTAEFQIISPEYFRALRIPIRTGRDFTASDGSVNMPVAIVNQTLAARWWPDSSPIGRFVRVSNETGPQLADQPRRIVAVVSDIHASGLDRPTPPTIFIPAKQAPDGIREFVNRLFLTSIVVRAPGESNILKVFPSIVESVDSGLPLASLRPLDLALASSLERPRFYAMLTSAFGMLALLLTAVGVYAVLRYHSEMRTSEMGLRMLLGANRLDVAGMLIVQGLKPVLFGAVLGIAGALFMEKLLGGMLYNLTILPVGIVLASAVALTIASGIACALSSLRVALIEPSDVIKGY